MLYIELDCFHSYLSLVVCFYENKSKKNVAQQMHDENKFRQGEFCLV